jgi:hypothetical protein
MFIAFILCAFTGINKILVILLGVVVGIVIWKREDKNALP